MENKTKKKTIQEYKPKRVRLPEPEIIKYLRENCSRKAKAERLAKGLTSFNVSELAALAGMKKDVLYNLIVQNLKNYEKYASEIERLKTVVDRLLNARQDEQ